MPVCATNLASFIQARLSVTWIYFFDQVKSGILGTCGPLNIALFWLWSLYMTAYKHQWWGAGMVICLDQGADLHMAQLMPLLLIVSCFSKIQVGFYCILEIRTLWPITVNGLFIRQVCTFHCCCWRLANLHCSTHLAVCSSYLGKIVLFAKFIKVYLLCSL